MTFCTLKNIFVGLKIPLGLQILMVTQSPKLCAEPGWFDTTEPDGSCAAAED